MAATRLMVKALVPCLTPLLAGEKSLTYSLEEINCAGVPRANSDRAGRSNEP